MTQTAIITAAAALAAAHRNMVAAEKADTSWLGGYGRSDAMGALERARKDLRAACGGPREVYHQGDIAPGVLQAVTDALEGAGIVDAHGAVAPWAWDRGPGHGEAIRVVLA